MLRNISKRLSRVEETIPLPFTPERFSARVQQRIRRTGESFDVAIKALLKDLNEAELHWLVEEGERAAFGSDTAARDEAKRKVLGEYYNPDEQHGTEVMTIVDSGWEEEWRTNGGIE